MSVKGKTAALLAAAVVISSGFVGLPVNDASLLRAEAITYQTSLKNAPVLKSAYTSTDKDITISWNKVSGTTGYYIYRWSANAPAWVRVGTATSVADAYTDKKVVTGTSYKYYVVAYKNSGSSKIMSGRSNEIVACAAPAKAVMTDYYADSTVLTVMWGFVKGSGYEVYYQKGSGSWKLASKITSQNTTQCDIKGLSAGTKYKVRVRAFTKDSNGKTVYGQYSDPMEARTAYAFTQYVRSSQYLIDRLDSAKLTPGQNTYYEYDRQSAKETKKLVTLSDGDIAIIKRFADSNLTADMTAGEKVDYTVQWLHWNVVYADGQEGRPEYSSIWNYSYVDAAFDRKAGQCLQYNSALCAMMRYLGYDARVVKGWRGSSLSNKWQHFWCEVTINGKDYVMDTYNVKDGAGWYFVCASYEETAPYSYNSHYIMNNELMSPYSGESVLNKTLRIISRTFGSR